MKNVPVGAQIQATFSYPMDPVTVNKDTFIVGGVTGSVAYQDKTATFTPAAPFEKGKRYDAILTTGIKDLDGIPLPSNVTWFFETEGDPGLAPPTVVATVPADGAQGVPPHTPIMVVFSRPMDQATINAGTFIVSNGTTGKIDYNEETFTLVFQPSPLLAASTGYSVTVTTGVRDRDGRALAQEKKWSFKTAGGPDHTAPRIEEQSPDDGAEGVPVNASVTVKFNEEIKSESVTSRFVLSGPQGEVPAKVSYAVGERTAALKPASDLSQNTTYQVTVKKGVEDLSRNATTADFTWSFKTDRVADLIPPVMIGRRPEGNRVAVKSPLTVQFSEPMDAGTVKRGFTLIWPEGSVSVGADYDSDTRTATLDLSGGRLAYLTAYTVLLSDEIADLAGNRLAEPRSWSFTTTDPPFVAAHTPTGDVASTVPPIAVTFSRPMKQETIDSDNFRVARLSRTGSGRERESVSGTFVYSFSPGDPVNPIGAIFTPSEPLRNGDTYQVTLTTEVEDSEGNPLASSHVWTFSVGPPLDASPPDIVGIAPAEGAAGVSILTSIRVTFSEPMNPATLDSQTFFIEGGVAGEWRYDEESRTAQLIPAAPLAYSARYTVTVTQGAQDLGGNPLASGRSWFFTTEADPNVPPDTVPPSVVSTFPENGATGVPTSGPFGQPTRILVRFSEAVRSESINEETFRVERVERDNDEEGPRPRRVSGSYQIDSAAATFFPDDLLERETVYIATLTPGVRDAAGNALSSDHSWSFTTSP